MAILSSYNLGLEIRFIELDSNNWVQYEIRFLYKDEPMAVDSQLKRSPEHWSKRSPGAFLANQYGQDGFLPTLWRALETEQPQFFTPIDPDVTLAIYPRQVFPRVGQEWSLIYRSQEDEQDEQDAALIREVAGALDAPLPDDPFTVVLKVDMYNYGHTPMYMGSGPALILLVKRHELLAFTEALQREYDAFCAQWGIEPPG